MVQTETLLRYAQLGYEWRHWYADARAAIAEVCARFKWDVDKFIEVMAITSPRVQVSRNWGCTFTYMRTGQLPKGVIRSTRTALSNWERGQGIKGRKTGPFAEALKGRPDALVLDTWMAVALGVEHAKVTRLDNLAAARRRVERVAGVLGCTTAEAQAAIWCGVIMSRGSLPARFERAADGTIRLHNGATKPLFGDWT